MLQLPTDSQTQGPQQTQNSMTSDTRVASERTLLQNANRIQYGNLLTLPIADGGILYVEPLYTERNTPGRQQLDVPAVVAGAGELPRTGAARRREGRLRADAGGGAGAGVRLRCR